MCGHTARRQIVNVLAGLARGSLRPRCIPRPQGFHPVHPTKEPFEPFGNLTGVSPPATTEGPSCPWNLTMDAPRPWSQSQQPAEPAKGDCPLVMYAAFALGPASRSPQDAVKGGSHGERL